MPRPHAEPTYRLLLSIPFFILARPALRLVRQAATQLAVIAK